MLPREHRDKPECEDDFSLLFGAAAALLSSGPRESRSSHSLNCRLLQVGRNVVVGDIYPPTTNDGSCEEDEL